MELEEAKIRAMNCKEPRIQIEWHRRRAIVNPQTGKINVVPTTHKKKVYEKKDLLCDLVARYKSENSIPNNVEMVQVS